MPLDHEIRIGSRPPFLGRLPLIPSASTIAAAWQADEKFEGDAGRVAYAALGLVWTGEASGLAPLRSLGEEILTWRECNRDPIRYGEVVLDALIRVYGVGAVADLTDAALAACEAVRSSLPMQKEVDEAADPTSAPSGASIASTSNSASGTGASP